LRRAVELGVDFIDTADSYGPYAAEELIREGLHPYHGVLVATKGRLVRAGPGQWKPVGRPEYLRQEVEMSLRRLGLDRIGLYQLHRIDPKVPAANRPRSWSRCSVKARSATSACPGSPSRPQPLTPRHQAPALITHAQSPRLNSYERSAGRIGPWSRSMQTIAET